MDIETETVVDPGNPVIKQETTPATPILKRKRILDSEDEEEVGPPQKTAKIETATNSIVKAEPKKVASPAPKSQTPKRKRESSSSAFSSSGSESYSTSSSGSYSDSSSDSGSYSSDEESSPKKKKASPKKTPTKKAATPTKKTPTKKESPAKKKATPKKETTPSPKKKVKTEDKKDTKVKKDKKDKKLTDEAPEDVWWKQKEDNSWRTGKKANWKWRTLEHNGVCFPPAYEPHGVKMLYDGKKVALTPDQEEVASFYARYMQTDHVKKPQFSKNFFEGFKKLLGKGHVIKEFSKCDFTPILDHLNKEKEKRKERTKEEKEKEKKEKAALKEKYGYAKIDGRREALGNYMIEPPSLFLGRGDHPQAGILKLRIHPKDVTLNLGEDAPVPKAPNGEKYGAIVHNHEVGWVAFWRPKLGDGNKAKYVLFSANSSFKGKSDLSKFDKAQSLGKNIDSIRTKYMAELVDPVDMVRQRATALWIIDHLALRVGGEKSKSEADTVGCCSLRVEHLTLHEPLDVEFDFLGKDSMRYQNRVKVDPLVYKNIKSFMKGKKKGEDVFDLIKPQQLNAHLQTMMKGLTAKVFRTYNASVCMQQQLDKWDTKKTKSCTPDEKLLFFNASSVEVAILCNHKRSVPQTFVESMGKLDQQIKDFKQEIEDLKDHKKRLASGKSPKKLTKKEGEDEPKPLPSNADACDKKIELLKTRIKKIEVKKTDKDQQKEISTGTSKTNYIDPRISITWCNNVGLDVNKIFPKTLRDKFGWAMMECEKKPKFRF